MANCFKCSHISEITHCLFLCLLMSSSLLVFLQITGFPFLYWWIVFYHIYCYFIHLSIDDRVPYLSYCSGWVQISLQDAGLISFVCLINRISGSHVCLFVGTRNLTQDLVFSTQVQCHRTMSPALLDQMVFHFFISLRNPHTVKIH